MTYVFCCWVITNKTLRWAQKHLLRQKSITETRRENRSNIKTPNRGRHVHRQANTESYVQKTNHTDNCFGNCVASLEELSNCNSSSHRKNCPVLGVKQNRKLLRLKKNGRLLVTSAKRFQSQGEKTLSNNEELISSARKIKNPQDPTRQSLDCFGFSSNLCQAPEKEKRPAWLQDIFFVHFVHTIPSSSQKLRTDFNSC